MSADEYRRKAQHFLNLARQITRLEDRAAMVKMAAVWMERAEEAEREKRPVQTQPEKEPERERS